MNWYEWIARVAATLVFAATTSIVIQPETLPQAAEGVPRVVGPPPAESTGSAWTQDPEVSWYGPGFYGKRTACGLAYTKSIRGVAHRTLPCGTLVEFRYRGKTAIVPVIDRGPYVAGRTWDLSGGLCTYLRHCFTGSIEWRLVGNGPKLTPPPTDTGD